jgi:hypothetical protein
LLYLFLFGLSLCLFCPSPSPLVSFLSTLCLFYPKPLSKKTQPLFLLHSSVRTFTYYICLTLLLGPFCQLSPRRRLFKLCTRRVYNLYIHISYCTQNRRSHNQNQTIFANFDIFLPNKFAHIKYLLYLCSRKF